MKEMRNNRTERMREPIVSGTRAAPAGFRLRQARQAPSSPGSISDKAPVRFRTPSGFPPGRLSLFSVHGRRGSVHDRRDWRLQQQIPVRRDVLADAHRRLPREVANGRARGPHEPLGLRNIGLGENLGNRPRHSMASVM